MADIRLSAALIVGLATTPSYAEEQPKPVPRATFIIDMDTQFRKIDADKDGLLTRPEIENYQKSVAQAEMAARNRALFDMLDTDRNGQMSPAEFAKLPAGAPAVDPTRFLRFDTSRDGKVSLIEHRTATLANFDRLDTNKDGNVTPAEAKAGGIAR